MGSEIRLVFPVSMADEGEGAGAQLRGGRCLQGLNRFYLPIQGVIGFIVSVKKTN